MHTGEKPSNCNEGNYKCEVCGYKCNQESELIKHMMSHKKDTVFRCPICIYKCNSQRVLEQHLSEQKELNDHGSGYYTCKECEYTCWRKPYHWQTFTVKGRFNVYLREHTEVKRYQCC